MSAEWPTESHNYGVPRPLDLSPEDRLVAQIVISLAKANPIIYSMASPQQVDNEVREQLGIPVKYKTEKKDERISMMTKDPEIMETVYWRTNADWYSFDPTSELGFVLTDKAPERAKKAYEKWEQIQREQLKE